MLVEREEVNFLATKGGREEGREGGREGGRERGRKGGREGGRERREAGITTNGSQGWGHILEQVWVDGKKEHLRTLFH